MATSTACGRNGSAPTEKQPSFHASPLVMPYLSFSPDGEHIYFARRSARGPMRVLYRIPTLGGLETPVLEDVDSPISFSPDGREFVFQRGTAEGATIVVAAADGSSQRTLATRKPPLGFGLSALSSGAHLVLVPMLASPRASTAKSSFRSLVEMTGCRTTTRSCIAI